MGRTHGSPHKIRRSLCAALAALAVCALTACHRSGHFASHPSDSPTATSSTAGAAIKSSFTAPELSFALTHPRSLTLTKYQPQENATPIPDAGCPIISTTLHTSRDDTIISFEAVPRDCDHVSTRAPGNGYHGDYRTLDDVKATNSTVESKRVTTPIGEAVIFEQRYFECTNSCRDWDEPVAIITVNSPASPRYPTLTARSDRGKLSEAELSTYLGQLGPA